MDMVTWSDLKSLKLPLWEVLVGLVAVVGVAYGAFAWADSLEDKQVKTQDQLDQLVIIVTKTTTDNSETHEIQAEELDQVAVAFELLKQELEIRRELEEAADNGA